MQTIQNQINIITFYGKKLRKMYVDTYKPSVLLLCKFLPVLTELQKSLGLRWSR
jgi:hypothetical protein